MSPGGWKGNTVRKLLLRHPLIRTLTELRGNTLACVWTEPLWGLSMNLCLPYASVYMLALGLSDAQVGLVASIYMFSQTIFAFLSGAITDRYGRRLSTALFDFIAHSIPCLIWASSQGFWFFAVAALLNGVMKVPTVAWSCLVVEDAPRDKITHIYSWITIGANMSALFAPISSILVSRLTLVPAIRILYINAFVVMTLKIFLLYKFTTETSTGLKRMEAVRGMTWGQQLRGYKGTFKSILTSPATIFAIIISILVEIVTMINMTFWQIIASRRIGIPDTMLPIFPMVKSLLVIVLFFTVLARIQQARPIVPLAGGFISAIVSALLLISVPGAGLTGYVVLGVSLLLESLGYSVLSTMRESLVATSVNPDDRSRIMALLQTSVMLVSVPFGYIAGLLSDLNRALPFVLNMVLLLLGLLAAVVFFRKEKHA